MDGWCMALEQVRMKASWNEGVVLSGGSVVDGRRTRVVIANKGRVTRGTGRPVGSKDGAKGVRGTLS